MSFRNSFLLACLVTSSAFAKAPKLTLFISVDALSSDILLRNQYRLKGGLAQMMSQGAYFPVAQYDYAECVTAPGHTTLVTGTLPSVHGINSNRYWNRSTEKFDRMFVDASYPLLEGPLKATEDASPKNLRSETLSDRLILATHNRGKSISISAKGRSAIPMAGQLGKAYWFHEHAGKFITSTYYSKAIPTWLKAFNERKFPESYFGNTWDLFGAAKDYLGEDNRPFEADYLGLGRAFPHTINGNLPSVGPPFYEALVATPMMNDIMVELAKAAIDGELLGKDNSSDILFIGFSSTDHVYHHHGPYSWEMQDTLLRLDKALATLLAHATKAAGGVENLLVVLSADHGGSAIPEEWIAAGINAARVKEKSLVEAVNARLAKRFGTNGLVLNIEEVDAHLNQKLIAEKKLDGVLVRRAAAEAFQEQPGIELAVAKDDLFKEGDKMPLRHALRNGYVEKLSGDVLVVSRVHHVLSDEIDGASHGTPYAYDSQVPLLLYGKGIRAGRYEQWVKVTSIAPTVAAILKMAPPAQSVTAPLVEALKSP